MRDEKTEFDPNSYSLQRTGLETGESTMDSSTVMTTPLQYSRPSLSNDSDRSSIYQKSLKELDEAIASVQDVCKTQRSLHNQQQSSSSSITISTIDCSTKIRNTKKLIENLHDFDSKQKRYNEKQSLDGHSNHSRNSSLTRRSNRSKRSSTSSRSRSRSRSCLRKELHFERTVRATILEAFEANKHSPVASEDRTITEKTMTSYSTDDILEDLVRTNAILTDEILAPSTEHRVSTISEAKQNTAVTKLKTNKTSTTSILRKSSFSRRSQIHQNRDVEYYRNHVNILPPIQSQQQDDDDEDDSSWLQSRTAEPSWANTTEVINPPKSKGQPLKETDVCRETGIHLHKHSSFDEWGFEEMVFPNMTGSTADITSSSKSNSINRVDDGRLESKTSSDDMWTNFGRNPFSPTPNNEADDCSHHSPNSVADCSFHAPTNTNNLSVSTSKQSPISALAAEAAWVRRLHSRGGRIRLH